MRLKILAAIFMVALFALIEFRRTGSGGGQPLENIMDGQIPQEKRISAPDFLLKDLSGRQVDLAAYKGTVVLLGFWTTW